MWINISSVTECAPLPSFSSTVYNKVMVYYVYYLKGTNFRAYSSRNFAQRPENARNLIPKLCAVLRCAKINTEYLPKNRKITQNHEKLYVKVLFFGN